MKNWVLRFRQVDRSNFEHVRSGLKTIETRAATVKYQSIAVGDTLTFVCGVERFVKKIVRRWHWPDVDTMVQEVSFKDIAPDAVSVDNLKKMYASFPGYEEKIRTYGLLGFEVE